MSNYGRRRGMMVEGGAARMPYPCPFSRGEQLAIEEAIRVGLAHVLRMGTVDPHSASEVAFTTQLVKELNRMMDADPPEVEGFSAALLETIPKGGRSKTTMVNMSRSARTWYFAARASCLRGPSATTAEFSSSARSLMPTIQ
jgi:hypothetical protein